MARKDLPTASRQAWPWAPLSRRVSIALLAGWAAWFLALFVVAAAVVEPSAATDAHEFGFWLWASSAATALAVAVPLGWIDVLPRQEFECVGRRFGNAVRRGWVGGWTVAAAGTLAVVTDSPTFAFLWPLAALGIAGGAALFLSTAIAGWPRALIAPAYRRLGPLTYLDAVPEVLPNPIRERAEVRFLARRRRERAKLAAQLGVPLEPSPGPEGELQLAPHDRPWPHRPLSFWWLGACFTAVGLFTLAVALLGPEDPESPLNLAFMAGATVAFLWGAVGMPAGWFDVLATDQHWRYLHPRWANGFSRGFTPGLAVLGLLMGGGVATELGAPDVVLVVLGLPEMVLAVLFATLWIAGWPSRFLSPSIRQTGPYAVWDPIPQDLPTPVEDRVQQRWRDKQRERARLRKNARARERYRERKAAQQADAREVEPADSGERRPDATR